MKLYIKYVYDNNTEPTHEISVSEDKLLNMLEVISDSIKNNEHLVGVYLFKGDDDSSEQK